MTNKERYQRTFDAVKPARPFQIEEMKMHKQKNAMKKGTVAAVLIITFAVCGSTAAYAADLGGIRTMLTMWIRGIETPVQAVQIGEGQYRYYTDDGSFGMGGVAIDEFGNERGLTAEEIAESNTDYVERDENGRIWLYYYDQAVDITDNFDDNGICKIMLTHEGKNNYFTIKNEGDSFPYMGSSDGFDEWEE